MPMERKSGESYISYAKRLTNSVEDGIIEYKEYGDSLLGIDNNYSSENIRKFYYMFKKWLNNIDDEIEFNDESFAKEMEKIKFDVLVERKKLQRINREYLENARLEADTYRDWETDRKSTRLNSSHSAKSRMPSSA